MQLEDYEDLGVIIVQAMLDMKSKIHLTSPEFQESFKKECERIVLDLESNWNIVEEEVTYTLNLKKLEKKNG